MSSETPDNESSADYTWLGIVLGHFLGTLFFSIALGRNPVGVLIFSGLGMPVLSISLLVAMRKDDHGVRRYSWPGILGGLVFIFIGSASATGIAFAQLGAV